MRIVADDKIPFLQGVLEPFADMVYMPGKDITASHVKDADALILRTRTQCNEQLLEGSKVKFIASATIGYDHIDTAYCEQKGIRWINAPGCNSSSVQQYMASALLTLAKKKGFNIKERSLGVVGVGNVGTKVVTLAEILGMKVYLNDPPRERAEGQCGFISLNGIMRECDIISFHIPLNPEGVDKTYHLADEFFFSKLHKDTIIINTARGPVVDNNVLKNILKAGKMAGAILDVWEDEPQIDEELLALVDIGTPHIAGYSADGKANGTAMSVRALCEFFDLPYKKWYPSDIPEPDITNITVDCKDKEEQEVLYEVVTSIYDIMQDDSRLRNFLHTFEKQRGNYPLRREYPSYKVELKNNQNSALIQKIQKLGCKIV